MRTEYLVVLCLGITSCGLPDSGSPSPSLSTVAASIPPAASSMPAGTATLFPTASPGPAADLFPEVSGWSLVDAPKVATDFDAAANTYVAGLGSVQVLAAALATPDKTCCSATVVAFVIEPDSGHTQTELFATIVDGVRAGVAIDPQPACDGQAVSLAVGEEERILGPWTGGPDGSYLVAVGSSTGASRGIYAALLGLPGGCTSR
jgi:hypothetical protein